MPFSPQLQPTEPANPTPASLGDVNESTYVSGTNPHAAPHTSQDHASFRSCITCRRRKVRCNKRSPCSNCARAGIECVFPPPGRAPRKSKRPQDAELLSRLRRLEGVIEHLSERKAATGNATGATAPASPEQGADQAARGQHVEAQCEGEVKCPFTDPSKNDNPRPLEYEFGRLVIDEGRSRYVSNRFWASLGDEIEELQDILDPSSSDEEDHPSPGSTSSYSTNHDGFLFGFYSLSHSLRSFYPTPAQISALWAIYTENVAPILPAVWSPAAQRLYHNAVHSSDSLDKNSEALALSMYFATIISASNEECLAIVGEDRQVLVSRYRFAVEQALAKANLLNTQSLMLLQAAVIFLHVVRREDDTKFVWSMTALVLRLAEGLGLHRDGTHFGLKPFETEIRRRLWWLINILDVRSAEDHGTDVQIHERLSDTRLPLNINDDDISPDMEEPPQEREGFTQMTLSIVRAEVTVAMRRVSYTCPAPNGPPSQTSAGSCGNVIQTLNKRIEERYLRYIDLSVPIQWVTATIPRLVLTKMWLIIHHPMTHPDRPMSINNASRESLFVTSVELAEFARLLATDKRTAKWSWMFSTYLQWHALAFVLSELCVRPLSPMTDRAWIAASTLYEDWIRSLKQRKSMLWRPLSRLMKRAAAFRSKQRDELQAQLSQSSNVPRDVPAIPTTGQPSMETHYLLPMAELQSSAGPLPLSDASLNGMDFDMTKGPIGVINEFFPGANWLATPSSQNSSGQESVPENAGVPMGSPTEPPPIDIQEDTSNLQLNWQEWDQVMREFQMDVQEESGNSMTWLG